MLAPEGLVGVLGGQREPWVFVGESGTTYVSDSPLGPFLSGSAPLARLARVSTGEHNLVGVSETGRLLLSEDAGSNWHGVGPSEQRFCDVLVVAPRALALATYQRAYDRYLQGVRDKVDPLWEFPRELAVRMEQGDVLVGFTIRKNGSVADVRVLKASGFDKFDKNVVAAIKKAAPFGPLPETLGAELRVTAPFEGSNPAIR